MLTTDKIAIKKLGEQLSDEEFFELCMANPDLNVERDKHKNIIIMSPITMLSGIFENELSFQLTLWNRQYQKGIVFSPSTGFTLPDTSILSPDVSWLLIEKWESLADAEKNKFAKVVPDFIGEIRSKSDRLKDLKAKMEDWIANGVQLAWLLDPKNEEAYIYRADGSIDQVKGYDQMLSGEDVLRGFELDLAKFKV